MSERRSPPEGTEMGPARDQPEQRRHRPIHKGIITKHRYIAEVNTPVEAKWQSGQRAMSAPVNEIQFKANAGANNCMERSTKTGEEDRQFTAGKTG